MSNGYLNIILIAIIIIGFTAPAFAVLPVTSIFLDTEDGKGGKFDAINYPHEITTIVINGKTYALVTDSVSNAVQIIDISDPYSPLATSSVFDETKDRLFKDFKGLDGAHGITTIVIDKIPYALVGSHSDDAVQIIDIKDPISPLAVSSVADGEPDDNGVTFQALNGPYSITAVVVDKKTYALIASYDGNEVQIIDITDPKSPLAVKSILYDNTFALKGAASITTIVIDEITYALVASRGSGVQIIDISDPHNPISVKSILQKGDFDAVRGANDITAVVIDGKTYALVASWYRTPSSNGGAVQILDISNPKYPIAVKSIFDGNTFDALGGAFSITTVVIDKITYAIVASYRDHAVQIIDISNPYSPIAVKSIFDDGEKIALANANYVTIVVIDGKTYALVTSPSSSAVQILDISNPYPLGNTSEDSKKKGGGGCNDCVPPTLGLNKDYKRVVDNGFSYNNNLVQVDQWHTPFPLINATVGEINTVEIIIYENQGITNFDMAQFGLGAKYIGELLNDVEVLIEVHLESFGTDDEIGVEKIVVIDNDNLIESSDVAAIATVVKCNDTANTAECIKVTLQYSYREPTIYNVMMIAVSDNKHNNQNFYFNDGINVIGDSLNEAPTYILPNKQSSQQTENLTLTLVRTDKINHIWIDEFGIEYKQISSDRFDRITQAEPYKCTDPPLNEVNVPTRKNCNFRDLTELWSYEQHIPNKLYN